MLTARPRTLPAATVVRKTACLPLTAFTAALAWTGFFAGWLGAAAHASGAIIASATALQAHIFVVGDTLDILTI